MQDSWTRDRSDKLFLDFWFETTITVIDRFGWNLLPPLIYFLVAQCFDSSKHSFTRVPQTDIGHSGCTMFWNGLTSGRTNSFLGTAFREFGRISCWARQMFAEGIFGGPTGNENCYLNNQNWGISFFCTSGKVDRFCLTFTDSEYNLK